MYKIETILKNVIQFIIREFFRVFWIFPVKRRRIMFSSYSGEKVTGNPQCIYDFLRSKYSKALEYIWVYNGNRIDICLPEDVKVVKKFSIKWFYYMATSKVIIDNCKPMLCILMRKEQKYIETWHAGGAYKKVGIAAVETRLERIALEDAMKSASVFLSSSEGFTRSNIKIGYCYTGKVLKCGMPRNDIFFDESAIKAASDKVRDYFSLQGIVVMYAPTYRGNLRHADELKKVLDIERLENALEEKYHQAVNILIRGHHWDKHKYGIGHNITDADDYPDMQELLCASDILITDYSSSIWDYALLGRPCLLYAPDIDEYIENRGFFTPPKQWPGILCKTMDELCDAINSLDENCFKKRANNYLKEMESYESGHATEIVSKLVMDVIKN